MNKDKEINKEHGKILMSWSFSEDDHYERSWMWYVGILLVGLLFLVYAIMVNNFLFALIILISVIIIFTYSVKEPTEVNITITDNGIAIGKKFFSYEQLKNFWIVYNPPQVKKLFFNPKSRIMPELTVSLGDENPLKVREMLLKYLEEDLDREEEPLSEEVARWFKI